MCDVCSLQKNWDKISLSVFWNRESLFCSKELAVIPVEWNADSFLLFGNLGIDSTSDSSVISKKMRRFVYM